MKTKILFTFILLALTFSMGKANGHNPQKRTDNNMANKPGDNVQTFTDMDINCTFSLTITTTSFYCNSSADGTATVVASGGTAPYTYLWSPGGQTTTTITGLSPATYTITVHDNEGCTATGIATVVAYTPIVTATATPNHIAAGDSTLLFASSSLASTYIWTPSVYVTNPNAQSTYAHPRITTVYTVTATSDTCRLLGYAYDTVYVSGCTFNLNTTSTDYYCAGLEGTATANPSGGTLPYTYLWAPGGQTTATISGLTAGGYSVTVTDSAGCRATKAITISAGTITLSTSANPMAITAGDSALLKVSCNVPATFSWAPSSTVRNPNLDTTYAFPTVTTMYTVTATTACGNITDSALVMVNCFVLNMTSTPYYCNSSYEGTATVTPSGGIPPYTYSWAPGGQTTAAVTGLLVGTYTVTVHDSTGCQAISTVTINRGFPVTTATATPNTIAAGDSTLLAANCNLPAGYSWQPSLYVTQVSSQTTYAHPPVTTVFTVTAISRPCGLVSVAYDTVWVTGCSIFLSATTTPYTCSSYQGSATITPSGGTAPYTYSWAPGGQTTALITGLSAGGYTVTVTDSAGCRATKAITISSSAPTYSVMGNPININPGDSSLLRASCSVPATYSWAPSATVRNPTNDSTYAYPPVTTEYTVTINTACGSFTDSVLINVNCFNLSMSSTSSYFCSSSYAGSATVTPIGGTPPYTYLWNPGGKTTATITGLAPGTYSVTVHDSMGCSAVNSISVSSITISLTVSAFPPIITVGDSSYLSVSCPVPATYSWAPAASLSCTTCANPWATPTVTTVYTVTAIDSCGQTLYGYDTVVVANCTNNFNEPICIVSVDTANNHPIIIWGRTNSPPGAGSYTVYKENSSFVFVPIDNQPIHVLSDFIDTASNPSLGPISYKLATDDSCGQSALSPVHTTIYLTATAGVNVNILNWTAYVGFIPSWYRIFRGPALNALVKIDSVPSTVLTYHDTLPPPGSMYLVQAVNPFSSCIPSLKIKTRSFSWKPEVGSLSNSSEKIVTGGNTINPQQIKLNIFPNPSNGSVTLQSSVVSGNWTVGIYNELGQELFAKTGSGILNEKINTESFASGIYSVRVQANNTIMVKKLVVMGR